MLSLGTFLLKYWRLIASFNVVVAVCPNPTKLAIDNWVVVKDPTALVDDKADKVTSVIFEIVNGPTAVVAETPTKSVTGFDEITRLENSEDPNKETKIENLKKRYTIGELNFDSVIVADFDESLKSVITSLLYTDVSPKDKYFITFNQWFDESLLNEASSQPIYYPSINKKKFEKFEKKFFNTFNENPNHLSLLSYDLIGLIYYLSFKNDLSDIKKVFKSKSSFRGKIGIFDIENNRINHRLNFYKVDNGSLKEIF